MSGYESLPGSQVYSALKDKSSTILAVNPRINVGILNGLFEAAKYSNSIIIFELAKSECNLAGGYTGLTPEIFARNVKEAAERADWPWFILHGDHLTIPKRTLEEINGIKELILSQIKNGYRSFAIDASFLFNLDGETTTKQLKDNIEVTTEIAKFIKNNMKGKEFGLEVEVGEIGKKNEEGLVLTTVEEAVTFIRSLHENDIHPNLLAIANGTTHGNVYDDFGNPIEKPINIPRTIEIAKKIEKYGVRIAQHGTTGTPLDMIATEFPKGKVILKCNVGTHWMNISWDVLRAFKPKLYREIWNWVINYKKSDKKPEQKFGEDSKQAIKQFFNEIYEVDEDTQEALKSTAYVEALKFIRAFNSKNIVDYIKK